MKKKDFLLALIISVVGISSKYFNDFNYGLSKTTILRKLKYLTLHLFIHFNNSVIKNL